jgi:tight adherence protein B
VSIIYLCIALFIFAIGIAIVMAIHSKKPIKTSILDEGRDKDVIDTIIDGKRKQLASRPWGMKLNVYIGVAFGGMAAFGGAGYLFTKNVAIAAVIAVAGFFLPEAVEMFRHEREKAKFEERYARALQQIASSVKSGLSIRQAVHDICSNYFIHDSIRNEFKQLDSDLQVGLSIHEGFDRFAKRVGSDDAVDVAIAISLQNQLGGDTGAIIETVTRDIYSRISNRRETKSLFAGSSSTIMVMDILPIVIIGFMAMASPQYLAPFFSSFTMKCVFWGLLGFMGLGSVVIRRIIKNMKKDSGV